MNLTRVFVEQNGHANLDSLPLRFDMHFAEDTFLTVDEAQYVRPDKSNPERHHFKGKLQPPEKAASATMYCHMVVCEPREGGIWKLVTAWCNDAQTELYLSETLKNLRKDGLLTPAMLRRMHPLYLRGEVNSSSALIQYLSKELVAADLERLNETIRQTDEQMRDLKRQLEESEREREQLKQREENRLREERTLAREGSQDTVLSSPDVLVEVAERVMHRSSSCTVITLGDGSKRYLKTATFDPHGYVTKRAHALVGRRVRTTSWDPVHEPGKWSKQGYFRNIYELE